MEPDLTFTPYTPGTEFPVYQLIRQVYDEFVAPDYVDAGNQFFYDWIRPEHIAERQANQQNLWIAWAEDNVVGMIEMRQNDHISLLFVDKNWQGKGIARELFRLALTQSLQREPRMKKIFVHASPFSIPVYEKLGFVANSALKEEHEIKYLPMEMEVSSSVD